MIYQNSVKTSAHAPSSTLPTRGISQVFGAGTIPGGGGPGYGRDVIVDGGGGGVVVLALELVLECAVVVDTLVIVALDVVIEDLVVDVEKVLA